MTPEQRALRSRIASLKSWANTDDPSARTAPARAARMTKWEERVDPERRLSEPERQRRAQLAFRAHMLSLAAKSAKARAARTTAQ